MKHARRGFSIAVVLLFGSLILFAAVLVLAAATSVFNEKKIITERLYAENAAEQLSNAAQYALKAEIRKKAVGDYFTLSAAPLENPLIDIPADTFSIITQKYDDLILSVDTYDMHYSESFWQTAVKLNIAQIAPYKDANGSVVRSYFQKVSAAPKDGRASAEISKIIIAAKSVSGDVSFDVTSAVR
ncbi:MAG: hypothetical protein Q4E17_03125 [Synergistes sp.]|nr:hypothetical protein [Synergistes sp.]